MTVEEERERGRQAAYLLEHPLMREAFDGVLAAYEDMWRNSAVGQSSEREKVWQLRTAAVEFREHFERWVRDGDVAARKIEESVLRAQGAPEDIV